MRQAFAFFIVVKRRLDHSYDEAKRIYTKRHLALNLVSKLHFTIARNWLVLF